MYLLYFSRFGLEYGGFKGLVRTGAGQCTLLPGRSGGPTMGSGGPTMGSLADFTSLWFLMIYLAISKSRGIYVFEKYLQKYFFPLCLSDIWAFFQLILNLFILLLKALKIIRSRIVVRGGGGSSSKYKPPDQYLSFQIFVFYSQFSRSWSISMILYSTYSTFLFHST